MELAFNTGLLGDYDYADINRKKYDKNSLFRRFIGAIIGIIIAIAIGIEVIACIGNAICSACSCMGCGSSSSSSSGCSSGEACQKTEREQYTIVTNYGETYTLTFTKYSSCKSKETKYSSNCSLDMNYYTLENYYSDQSMTKVIDRTEMKDGKTYYAKYTEKGYNDLYTIWFVTPSDSNIDVPDYEVRVGENVNLNLSSYCQQLRQYDDSFMGFYDTNGKQIINVSGNLVSGYYSFHLYNWTAASTSSKTVTLTAKFKARYTIKFDMSGTGLSAPSSISIKDGESIKINFTLEDVKRKGYRFLGFYDYYGNRIINQDLSINSNYLTFDSSYFYYDSNNVIKLTPQYEEIVYNMQFEVKELYKNGSYYTYSKVINYKEGDSIGSVIDKALEYIESINSEDYFKQFYFDYASTSNYSLDNIIPEEMMTSNAEVYSTIFLTLSEYHTVNAVLIPGGTPEYIKYKASISGNPQLPVPPEKAGWTFQGWYGDANFTNEIDSVAQLTNYSVIYANWVYSGTGINTNTISFKYPDGSDVLDTNYTPSFSDKPLKEFGIDTAMDETRMLGYTFKGWDLYRIDRAGEVTFTKLNENGPVTVLPAMTTGEIEARANVEGVNFLLLARYAKDTNGITLGDASLSKTMRINFSYGSANQFDVPTVNSDKYEFVGYRYNGKWITDAEGYTIDKDGNSSKTEGNGKLTYESFGYDKYQSIANKTSGIEIDAIFKVREFTVKISVKGQIVDTVYNVKYDEAANYDVNKAMVLLKDWEEISGYSFEENDAINKKQLTQLLIREDTTIYAYVNNKNITITFEAGKVDDVSLNLLFKKNPLSIEYGYRGTLDKPNYSLQPQYLFVAYYYGNLPVTDETGKLIRNLDAQGLNTTYAAIAENGITLTAKSEIKKFKVTINDGTKETYLNNIPYGTKLVESDLTAPQAPTGYTYAGWYLGNELYDFDTEITSNITLEAKFNPNKYNVVLTAQVGDLHDDIYASIENKAYELTYDGENYVLNAPEYKNEVYEFEGYFVNDVLVTDNTGKGTKFNLSTFTQLGINLTIDDLEGLEFEARYQKKKFTITLSNSYNSTTQSIIREYGSTLLESEIASFVSQNRPSNTNYYFAGWYHKNTSSEFLFSETIANNIEIVAIYRDVFTIRLFNDKGDSTPYRTFTNVMISTSSLNETGYWKDADDNFKLIENDYGTAVELWGFDYEYLYNCKGIIDLYKD